MRQPQVTDSEISQLIASHLNGRAWHDGRRWWFRLEDGRWLTGQRMWYHFHGYVENHIRHQVPTTPYWNRGRHRIEQMCYRSMLLTQSQQYLTRPADVPEHPTRPGWR